MTLLHCDGFSVEFEPSLLDYADYLFDYRKRQALLEGTGRLHPAVREELDDSIRKACIAIVEDHPFIKEHLDNDDAFKSYLLDTYSSELESWREQATGSASPLPEPSPAATELPPSSPTE